MGGNSLGQVYTFSLSCVYGRVEVRCGQVRLTTRHPSLVDGRQVLSGPPGCEVADRREGLEPITLAGQLLLRKQY